MLFPSSIVPPAENRSTDISGRHPVVMARGDNPSLVVTVRLRVAASARGALLIDPRRVPPDTVVRLNPPIPFETCNKLKLPKRTLFGR